MINPDTSPPLKPELRAEPDSRAEGIIYKPLNPKPKTLIYAMGFILWVKAAWLSSAKGPTPAPAAAALGLRRMELGKSCNLKYMDRYIQRLNRVQDLGVTGHRPTGLKVGLRYGSGC